MMIMALDLGRRMGVAYGNSKLLGRVAPCVETVMLRGARAEKLARYLGEWLHDGLDAEHYDLIVTESPMNPVASKSSDATIAQLYLHGALQGVAATFGVEVIGVPVMAVRKHFVGQACATPVRGRKRTSKEAAAAREFINEAVLIRAKLLGYLPNGSTDWDQANASALWDYACAKFASTAPASLALLEVRS